MKNPSGGTVARFGPAAVFAASAIVLTSAREAWEGRAHRGTVATGRKPSERGGRLPRDRAFVVGVCGLVVVLALVVVSASAATDVVTVPASADTYLRSGAPDTNEGGSSFLRMRASGDNRALVRFDQAALEQAVGSGTLVSASLKLDITGNGNNWGSSGRAISVFRLTSNWAEGKGFVDRGSPPNRGTGAAPRGRARSTRTSPIKARIAPA